MAEVTVGQRRHRLLLQRPAGLAADGYDPVGIERCAKRFASGNELLRFGTPSSQGAWVITMRYRSDLLKLDPPTLASWRLVDLDTEESFQISSFGDAEGTRRLLTLYCVEAQ
jgi:hypothetical protein